MGNDNQIDQLFKDTLGEVDFPSIPQAYLEDLNKRLDNYSSDFGKTGKGGGSSWKLWTVSVAGLVSAGLLFYVNQNKTASEVTVSEQVNAIKNESVIPSTNEVAVTDNIDKKLVNEEVKSEQLNTIPEHTESEEVEVSIKEVKDNSVRSKAKDIEQLGVVSGSIKYVVHSSGTNIIDRSADFTSLTSKKQLTKGQIQKNIHNIELYSKILESNPYDEYAYCNRGVSKEVLNDYKGAAADYSKVIKLNPKFINAYYNRANALMKLKEYKSAIKDFSKAIELDPNFAEAYNNRGLAYEVVQKSKEALKDYTKAIAINPKYIEAYYNRGVTYESLRDKKAAIGDYSKVIELNPSVEEAYYNRGFIRMQFEDYQNALADFNRAIEINPKNGNTYLQRGYIKRSLKEMDEACADWSKASELGALSADLFSEFCH